MPNQLSQELLTELYGQQSGDPFLTLFTLTHPTFAQPLRFVNNSEDIVSNGDTYVAFPVRLTLPPDDNESAREVRISFDNVSLELIEELRTVTTSIACSLQMVLASSPDTVQYSLNELKLTGITYNTTSIDATLIMDDFLSVGLTSERYTPSNFPGIF